MTIISMDHEIQLISSEGWDQVTNP